MSLHLHLVCGIYDIAVEAARVRELAPDPSRHADLPLVDLRALLDVPAPAEPVRVVMDGGFALGVDRVAGMVEGDDLAPLPALLRSAMFDGVLGGALLRLSATYDFKKGAAA